MVTNTGRPLIRLSKSCIGEVEKKSVMRVLDSEFLGMGSRVKEFETCLTDFFGRQAICVANGTAALQLALQACGIGADDEVLVQSMTYVASFQAITATGATPIPCDVTLETLTIDLEDAEKKITARTKAIMPVHYSGSVGNLQEIYNFAARHNLRVIEDAAHAFGTTYEGNLAGSVGDIACFSFDGIKNITSGEGGCVVTADEQIISKVQDARLLGVQNDTENRFAGIRSWEFDVVDQGWRYHMSDVMASIGIVQFGRLEEFATKRKALAKRYVSKLSKSSRISLFKYDYEVVTPHIFPVRVPSFSRDLLRKRLLEEHIQTGLHYVPNHQLTFFGSVGSPTVLPVTEKIFPELITLPLHPDLTFEDVDYVVDRIIFHLKELIDGLS